MLWKRKTDEEYVGTIRKLFFGWSKLLALLHASISGAAAVLALTVIQKARAVEFLVGEDFELGFLMGSFVCFMLVTIVANAVFAWVIFFKPRSISLLIEYHERLRELRSDQPAAKS